MVRVFLSGASGNVGKTIVRTIREREGFELAGGWCREAGQDLGTIAGIGACGVIAAEGLEEGLAAAKPDLVIDFSAAQLLEENLRAYLKFNLNAVIGTTGLTHERLDLYKKEVAAKKLRWAVIANYGLGIALVTRFIREVRKYYPYVSILDKHHENMANAPSGTAAALAKAASGEETVPAASRETYPGVLGAKVEGIPVLSQRLPWPGPYSGHEITLGRKDEILRISVEDYTSDIYMDGLFLTAGKIASFPPGSFIQDLTEVMNN